MNREEALDKANQLVTEWMEQVKNARGYVHDSWRPADPAARTDAVIKLAEFLWEPDVPNRVVPPMLVGSPQLCTECLQPVAEGPGEECMDQEQHGGP